MWAAAGKHIKLGITDIKDILEEIKEKTLMSTKIEFYKYENIFKSLSYIEYRWIDI